MDPKIEDRWDALCGEVSGFLARDRVPGAALGVVLGEETFTAGFGVTNVDHPLDVTDETYFQVGSISKTFTATAILKLVEGGKVDLEETVRAYVPDFGVADEDVSARVTVRHLLTHTGGWEGDYFRHTGEGDDAVARYMEVMKEIPQLAPLGAVWSYNNAGFAVLGRILETVTGKTCKRALEEIVLEPLGLSQCLLDPRDVMVHRFVAGHKLEKDVVRPAEPWALPRYSWAAGGVLSSITELLRYARFHLGDGRAENGERLLASDTLEAMRSPQVRMWGETETMGLSWFMRDAGPFREIWHGGGTTGQVCMLHLVPARDFAVGILTNAGFARHVLRETVRSALKRFLDYEPGEPKPLEAPAEELAPIAGKYWRPFAEMELGILGGKLVCFHALKAGFPTEETPAPPPSQPFTVDLCEKDRLVVLEGEYRDGLAEVLRKSDGSIGWLRFGGRIYERRSA